jgi:hypothetical protein
MEYIEDRTRKQKGSRHGRETRGGDDVMMRGGWG